VEVKRAEEERERETERETLGERRQEAECCLSKHGEAADHPRIYRSDYKHLQHL
jgi:hypothetical protein